MIYKVFLIDAESGISLLEANFKEFSKTTISKGILFPNFFKAINETIDNIHAAMAKGRRVNEMTRIVASEDSTIIIYYHPLSHILFCTLSDADDEVNKLKEVVSKIGQRFWKKHRSDLEIFRTTTEKIRLISFQIDIENLTMGGRIAEKFPKLLLIKNVLDKVLSMGIIEDIDYQVALKCTGDKSSLKISRQLSMNRNEVQMILKKLEELDIITY